jgi:GAF domain-containing protein
VLEPPFPVDESERLQDLQCLSVLDTGPEQRFDRITRTAQRLFQVPMALVSLVDRERQWFKSKQGLDASETPRSISFCGHAILQEGVFVVRDASVDERFKDNPLVTHAPR